jgi:dipeptidyl-peptidase-4
MTLTRFSFWLLAISIISTVAAAQPDADASAPNLEELFGRDGVQTVDRAAVVWRPGRDTLTWVDPNAESGSALVEFDPKTEVKRVLLDTTHLGELWGARRGVAPKLKDPVFGPRGLLVLLNNGDDQILVDLASDTLTVLATGNGREEYPRFSPDGLRIAWVRDNDLFAYDLAAGREIRVSDDGSASVFNGVFDWVYQEELAGREGRAFAWSPDGTALIWLRLDDSEIPVHHLVDLSQTHSSVIEQRYPNPGDPSPSPSLHVAVISPQLVPSARKRISFEIPPPYVPRFGFTSDGAIWYQAIDRAQERLRLMQLDLESTTPSALLDERDPFWIEPVDGLHFLRDGSFLWLSRRGGFMHLYRIRPNGSALDLSPGTSEVTRLIGVGPKERYAWYQAARPSALERRIYRVDVANGETVKVTPSPGTHDGRLSPSGGKLLITSSSLERPPTHSVFDPADGSTVGVDVGHDEPPAFPGISQRFVTISADDGYELHSILILPPEFHDGGLYPVVVHIYGGPHAQVAVNSWPGSSGLFNRYLASRGFVVFALDNRGSSARGREFEGAVDRSLGSSQLPDQLAGIRWLSEQPWVNADRIGIWGWSYGGYMTTYALTHAPGTFAAGAAVAPVTDWRLYDSIYTERYMDTPEDNSDGYSSGSVLDAIAHLQDPLLVIHGTGDDNVHVQHTMQLADRAWRAGVRFELMLFPNLGHGIRSPGSHLQLFRAVAGFFEQHLMVE